MEFACFSLSHIIQFINSYLEADASCEGFFLVSSVYYSELAKLFGTSHFNGEL